MKPWMLPLFLVTLVMSASPAKAEDPKPSSSIAAAPAIVSPAPVAPYVPDRQTSQPAGTSSPMVAAVPMTDEGSSEGAEAFQAPAREQTPAAEPTAVTTVTTTTVTTPGTPVPSSEPAVIPQPEMTTRSPVPGGARLLVDDFEGEEVENKIGGRTNVFQKAPSKAMVSRREDTIEGRKTRVLMLRYDKQAEGGPYGMGGWCGYYTLLKKPGHLIAPAATPPAEGAAPQAEKSEEEYLDGTGYTSITFWIRGDQGNESFMIGLADRHWDKIGDSVKSEVIGKYLPAGKVTTTWQKAVVPLDAFFVDYAKLGSIAFSFESDAFPDGKGAGTLYLDDVAFE